MKENDLGQYISRGEEASRLLYKMIGLGLHCVRFARPLANPIPMRAGKATTTLHFVQGFNRWLIGSLLCACINRWGPLPARLAMMAVDSIKTPI